MALHGEGSRATHRFQCGLAISESRNLLLVLLQWNPAQGDRVQRIAALIGIRHVWFPCSENSTLPKLQGDLAAGGGVAAVEVPFPEAVLGPFVSAPRLGATPVEWNSTSIVVSISTGCPFKSAGL